MKFSHSGSRLKLGDFVEGLLLPSPFFVMRPSSVHILWKFACGAQALLDLLPRLDKKTLLRNNLVGYANDFTSSTLYCLVVNDTSVEALVAANVMITQLERDLQIARVDNNASVGDNRVTFLNRIFVRPKELASRWSSANLFGRYFPGVTDITIYEPYLSQTHQVINYGVLGNGSQRKQLVAP